MKTAISSFFLFVGSGQAKLMGTILEKMLGIFISTSFCNRWLPELS
jgi:hypothetical protein